MRFLFRAVLTSNMQDVTKFKVKNATNVTQILVKMVNLNTPIFLKEIKTTINKTKAFFRSKKRKRVFIFVKKHKKNKNFFTSFL